MLGPWKHLRTGPPVEPIAPIPSDVPRGTVRLDDAQVQRLALALHERRCSHTAERSQAECARISGAFDDVYAIEPEILALMRGGL